MSQFQMDSKLSYFDVYPPNSDPSRLIKPHSRLSLRERFIKSSKYDQDQNQRTIKSSRSNSSINKPNIKLSNLPINSSPRSNQVIPPTPSIPPFSHQISPRSNPHQLPFPVSSTSSINQNHSISTTDLFAGPRTSLQYDARTGELISAAHNVKAMDALLSTLGDSALPPALRNMNRETAKYATHSHEPVKSSRSYRKKKSISKETQSPKETSLSLCRQHSLATSDQAVFTDKPYHLKNHTPSREASLPSSSSSSALTSSTSTFVLPRCSSLQFSPDGQDITTTYLPPSALSRSPGRSFSDDPSRIPSINEIIARHATRPPSPINTCHSAIPFINSDDSIRTIDEIVADYAPLISTSASSDRGLHTPVRPTPEKVSNVPLSNNKAKNHGREKSSASSDTQSSIDSIAQEALRCLSVQTHRPPNPLCASGSPRTFSSCTRSISPPGPLRMSDRSRTPRPTREPPTPHAASRRTKSPSELAPPKSAGVVGLTADSDERIATYLQSPRLTTLLKLKKHPNTNMTVSLADVGSMTGHPVIVFLGLGCVRYLVALYDELAEALGLRLVCIDRWGLGKTSEVPDHERGFLEWSTVVEEVADQLHLGQFSILAHSAGAPYALASSLRLDQRVRGSIHLLAPWVSMTAENGVNAGGYRWLKYLPNSMIRTAQAAEWKVQGWRLGKPPSLNRTPVGYDLRAPLSSKDTFSFLATEYEDELEEEPVDLGPHEVCHQQLQSGKHLRPSVDSSLSDWSRLSSDTPWANALAENGKALIVPNSYAVPANQRQAMTTTITRTTMSGESASDGGFRSPRPVGLLFGTSKPSLQSLRRGSAIEQQQQQAKVVKCGPEKIRSRTMSSISDRLVHRPSPLSKKSGSSTRTAASTPPHVLPKPPSPSTLLDPTRSFPALGLALLRASYSESLKGGTSDLMAILERNSKPWGFSYKDVETPVKIWHGDRDERINVSAAKWMENVMDRCELSVVTGGEHSLMTNVKVMVEVLESIASDWNAGL